MMVVHISIYTIHRAKRVREEKKGHKEMELSKSNKSLGEHWPVAVKCSNSNTTTDMPIWNERQAFNAVNYVPELINHFGELKHEN